MHVPKNPAILVLAVFLLVWLLRCETREETGGRLVPKTALSLLFVLAALLQPRPFPVYFGFLLAGLLLCLGGDVLLALPQRGAFLAGLCFFLMGHVSYLLGFLSVVAFSWSACVVGATAAGVSTHVFFRLRPHLGSMKMPVVAYILAITLMVWGASSVLFNQHLTLLGRAMVFAGALAFYLSDLFVARERFLKPGPLNRLIGLPLYYAGQFLLAFSLGFVGKINPI